jgi:hypothetical protein
MPSILRPLYPALGLLLVGCVGHVADSSNVATGYLDGATYVTRIELPADIFGGGLNGRLESIQFLRNGDVDPMGGKIEIVAKGTTIRVSQVLIQKSSDLGAIVRIFATVISGPYAGTAANLYGISTQQRGADGKLGMLMRDPTVLEPVDL